MNIWWSFLSRLRRIISRKPTQEELTEPHYAYCYSEYIIRSRFPQGEPIIATHPQWACYYAINIIKRRWEQGEPAIAQDANSAFEYAFEVINDRFELGEPAIAKDAHQSYDYARYIIEGRWEQGEQAMAKEEYSAYFYSRYVLKFDIKYINFYEQCFRNGTLAIDQLSQQLQDDPDIQVAYFKAKVLK
jgi:hypothetical protein